MDVAKQVRTRNVDVKQEEARGLLEEGYRARIETAYGRGRREYRYLILTKGEDRRGFPLTPLIPVPLKC